MKHVALERHEGGLAELTLSRPKVNAMNHELLAELAVAIAELERDSAVRGLCVRAEGRCFSAGLDLMQLAGLDEPALHAFLDTLDDAFGAAFRFSKPMAAAVHGHAIAGGLVLALCADQLVLGRGDYKLGLTELAVGVPFPRVAYEIVAHGLPPRAMRLLVNGAGTHPPDELFALGVGDALVDDPVASAKSWLQMVCARPLETFRHVKGLRREAACEAMARQTLDERRRLVAAIAAARQVLSVALR